MQDINQSLLDRADKKLTAAATRLEAARNTLEAANTALAQAEAASSAAARGEGKLSAMDAENALELKARDARVASKVFKAAASSHQAVAEWAVLARGAAHSGMYLSALQARIGAAEKAERAKAMMEEAEIEMRAALETCHLAHLAGHPNIRGLNGGRAFVSASSAQIRAEIAGAGIDLEAGTYAWLEHVKTQEPEDANV